MTHWIAIYAVPAAIHAAFDLAGGPVAGMPRRPLLVIAVRAVAWPIAFAWGER